MLRDGNVAKGAVGAIVQQLDLHNSIFNVGKCGEVLRKRNRAEKTVCAKGSAAAPAVREASVGKGVWKCSSMGVVPEEPLA